MVPLAERALLAIRFEVASIDYAGPLTLASSLTLRSSPRAFRLPEGRPMIG